ncbi:SepM family pheromone-processing serine protease [Gorillibacterium timonense]|uniref:SepM family pheromone-processing serine protease n=1 Tax=Gorillibacterium timonense TaxID=1689269 RepID=UPI000A54E1DF|nr:SepM family pheromone-processing serine protease [Gorillibacterium timonense]
MEEGRLESVGKDGGRDRFPRKKRMWSKYTAATLVGILLAYFLVFYPLPYFIYQPGSAEDISPMITTAPGHPPDRGVFMLTTVGVMDANVVSYLWAKATHQEIRPKQKVLQGQTEEEYNQTQVYSMSSSQSNAILAAYKHLGIEYSYHTDSIMVLHLIPGMPASEVLSVGDQLLKVDGKALEAPDQLVNYLSGKQVGDKVSLTLNRGGKTMEAEVKLAYLPAEATATGGEENRRVGMGITQAVMLTVLSKIDADRISIKAGDIGGPSAGLMFTLEIINRLLPEDIAKGHRIAGTGTIEESGKVGPIGGIQHKVVAADREGAEIFFAPKDENGYTNYSDAKKEAEKIGTKMKIIPVSTLDDAIAYLKELPQQAAE